MEDTVPAVWDLGYILGQIILLRDRVTKEWFSPLSRSLRLICEKDSLKVRTFVFF